MPIESEQENSHTYSHELIFHCRRETELSELREDKKFDDKETEEKRTENGLKIWNLCTVKFNTSFLPYLTFFPISINEMVASDGLRLRHGISFSFVVASKGAQIIN